MRLFYGTHRVHRQHFFLFLLLALSLAGSLGERLVAANDSPQQPTAFSCTAITDVPQHECQALVAIHTATNGPAWLHQTNWLSQQQSQLCDVWYGISCTNGHVTAISLSANQLSGALPAALADLSHLQRLWLDQNQLSGTIPEVLSGLSQLQEITLWSNQFTGTIPASLGNLSNLTWLDLSRNQLSGALPVALSQLSNLRTLGAQENQLTGALPPQLGALSKLENLWLGGNQLTGAIPAELGNLAQLKDLGLWSNQLSGEIPAALGNLQQLTKLWLSGNQLSGAIPSALGNLTALQDLLLSSNQLSGAIPPALGNLTNLAETLGLNNNQLSGPIPAEFGNLTKLKRLSVRNNQLSGELPASLGNLSQLTILYLYNNPGVNGPLPATLANLTQMSDFQFQNTALCEPGVAALQSWLATITTVQTSGILCETTTGTPSPPTATPQPTSTSSTPSPTPTPTQTPTTAPPPDDCTKFNDYVVIPQADANLNVIVDGATVDITLDWTSDTDEFHLFAFLETYLFAEEDVVIPAGDYQRSNPTTFRISDLPDGTYHVVVVYNEIIGLAQQRQGLAAQPSKPQQTALVGTNHSTVDSAAPNASHATNAPPFQGSYHFSKPDCIERGEQIGDPAAFWDAYQFTVGAKPVITGIKPKYPLDKRRYLQAIPVTNEIAVEVDWQGRTPGTIELQETGSKTMLGTVAADATLSLNMGALPQSGFNTLQFIAYTAQSRIASEPYEVQVFAMPLPIWLTGLATNGIFSPPVFTAGSLSGEDVYQMALTLPPSELRLIIKDFIVPSSKTESKLRLTGTGTIPLQCAGTLSGELAGTTNLSVFIRGTEGTAFGRLESTVTNECELELPTFTAGGQIKGTYNIYSMPILRFIPYANPVLGTIVYAIIDRAGIKHYVGKLGELYIDGTFDIGTDLTFNVLDQTPYLEIDTWKFGGGLGLQGGFRADYEVAEVDAWLGTGGTISFARTHLSDWNQQSSLSFDKIGIYGEMGVKVRVFIWINQHTGKVTWEYPPQTAARLFPSAVMPQADWQIIPHQPAAQAKPFVIEPAAAAPFQAGTALAAQANPAAPNTQSSILVRNVYTYPETSLALDPTSRQGALLWVQTDAAKAVGQAHELLFSRWDGAAWSQPVAITDDMLLDFAPSAAWAHDGKLVTIWQRFPTPIAATAVLTDSLLQQSEIATAAYNPTTKQWSAVTLLTQNQALDMAPALARNQEGKLVAVWRQNGAGRLDGTVTNPDQVMVAFYDKGWSSPTVAVAAIPGLIDLATGYGNNTAQLVFSRYLTTTNALTPTLELFTSQWNGSTWSAPQALTSNSLVDQHNPQVIYNAANQPIVVWLAGNELRLRNLATGASGQPFVMPEAIGGLSDFTLVQAPSGNLAAVFTALNYPHALHLLFYDQSHQLWSTPTPLTTDPGAARDLSAVMDEAGRLLLGYAVTKVDLVTKTFTIAPDTTVAYPIAVEGPTNLMTLSRAFVRNLTLTKSDLVVTTSGNQITITATVRNTGDFAVQPVQVRFYSEESNGNRSAIGEQIITTPVLGQSTQTVTLQYTAPAALPSAFAAEVDPENIIAESDESDNSTFLKATRLYLPTIAR